MCCSLSFIVSVTFWSTYFWISSEYLQIFLGIYSSGCDLTVYLCEWFIDFYWTRTTYVSKDGSSCVVWTRVVDSHDVRWLVDDFWVSEGLNNFEESDHFRFIHPGRLRSYVFLFLLSYPPLTDPHRVPPPRSVPFPYPPPPCSSFETLFPLHKASSPFLELTEVYYESRKRELKRRLINEGRCDERLKAKVEESTYLTYTGLHDKTN